MCLSENGLYYTVPVTPKSVFVSFIVQFLFKYVLIEQLWKVDLLSGCRLPGIYRVNTKEAKTENW